MSDTFQERLIKLDRFNEFRLRLARCQFVPRSGYDLQPNVAARRLRWVQARKRERNPIGVESMEFDTQGSRGGNPGLEVATASRYLIRHSSDRSGLLARVNDKLKHIGHKGTKEKLR